MSLPIKWSALLGPAIAECDEADGQNPTVFMRRFPAVAVAALGLLAASCSDSSDADRPAKPTQPPVAQEQSNEEAESEATESELAPDPDHIGEDCVAFLRATKAVPTDGAKKDCPECPSESAPFEVLKFNTFRIEKVSPSGSSCEVLAEIRAEFNPSPGGTITGGLVGWISPAQRELYTQGQTPAGQQVYKVRIAYNKSGGFWRAVEFDRAN